MEQIEIPNDDEQLLGEVLAGQSTLAPSSLLKLLWINRLWQTFVETQRQTDREYLPCDLDSLLRNFGPVSVEYLVKFFTSLKKRDGADYPPQRLFQIFLGVQMIVNESGQQYNIMKGNEFLRLQRCVDRLMKRRAKQGIGRQTKQASIVTKAIESELWEKNILGDDSPCFEPCISLLESTLL